MIRTSVACVLCLGLAAPVFAQTGPIQWDGNGHYYEFVEMTLSWDEAVAEAESRTFMGVFGHLATIRSAGEQDFVFEQFVAPNPGSTPWLGGYQEEGAPEPDGGWRWITGEPFDFTAWGSAEPQQHLHRWTRTGALSQ